MTSKRLKTAFKIIFFGILFGGISVALLWFVTYSAADIKVREEVRTNGIETDAEVVNGYYFTRNVSWLNIRWKQADGTEAYALVSLSEAYGKKITAEPRNDGLPLLQKPSIRIKNARIKYLPIDDISWIYRQSIDAEFAAVILEDKVSFGRGCRDPIQGPCARGAYARSRPSVSY